MKKLIILILALIIVIVTAIMIFFAFFPKNYVGHIAKYAEEYGRDLFAVPYSVGIQSGAGCNELIKKGALLTDTPEDVLAFYGVENKKEQISLSVEQKAIVDLLKDGEMHIENICKALGKKVFEISPLISILEINKIVVKNGTNVYGLIRNDLEE